MRATYSFFVCIYYFRANNLMKIITLLACAMFAGTIVSARMPVKESTEHTVNERFGKSVPGLYKPAPWYGRRNNYMSAMICVDYGNLNTRVGNDSLSFKGNSFAWRISLGVKVVLPGSYEDAYKFFTVGVGYGGYEAKVKYPRVNNPDRESKTGLQVLSLPATLGYMRKPGKGGYYGVLGLAANYNLEAKPDGSAMAKELNKLWFEPSLSIGYFGDFVWVQGRSESAPFRYAFGPYVSYSVSNISAQDNVNMRFLQIGARFCWSGI